MVERAVRVGEVQGSNPCSPIILIDQGRSDQLRALVVSAGKRQRTRSRHLNAHLTILTFHLNVAMDRRDTGIGEGERTTGNRWNVSFGTGSLPGHRLRFSQVVLRIAIVRIQSQGFLELSHRLIRPPLL